MARQKKKKYNKPRPRRHSIGAVHHHGAAVMVLEQVGGLIGASLAATVMQRLTTGVNQKIVSAGQIAAGMWLRASPNPVMQGAGWGLMSIGSVGLAHDLGFIKGIEEGVTGMYGGTSTYTEEVNGISNSSMMTGISNSSMMTGISNSSILSGYDNDMVDYMNPIGR